MDRKREALRLHSAGMSCAQAVAGVFSDVIGLDRKTVFALSGTFGGGFKVGEICGVLSGAGLVLGARWPHDRENDPETKAATGEKMKAFLSRFRERFPALVCRELKELPAALTAEEQAMGLDRACESYIVYAVSLLEEMLAEEEK